MSFSFALEKLSKILRVKPEVLADVESKMTKITGQTDVLDNLIFQNQVLVERILELFDLNLKNPTAEEVYGALIKRLIKSDKTLFEVLGKPDFTDPNVCSGMCVTAYKLSGIKEGFFLKEEKAWQMLEENPPQNVLSFLGLNSVSELREKERIWEVFSALRFVESSDWMNKVFLNAYEKLEPQDFEHREVKIEALGGKWLKASEKFMKKKYHNLSHLKELGIIFILPIPIDTPGETIRIFSLLLHYLHEVPFYSALFEKYAREGDAFGKNLVSLLRGDVIEGSLPKAGLDTFNIRIVQRYLTKDNPDDPRLFEPHINPEAIHWELAERDIAKFAQMNPGLGLGFWTGLNWVGDFFPSEKNGETLIGMNLIDNIMSLVKSDEMAKYLYHQQEALWNQIFIDYLGEKKVNDLIAGNITKGYINFIQ